jgi:hypothetical protein
MGTLGYANSIVPLESRLDLTHLDFWEPPEQDAFRPDDLADGPDVIGGHPEPVLRAVPQLVLPTCCASVAPPQLQRGGIILVSEGMCDAWSGDLAVKVMTS